MTSEETARFTAAKERIIGKNRERNGIGTLSEKTVHAVLKNYYAPDETQHEIPVEGCVADIFNGKESLILFAMLFSGGLIPTFMVVNSLKLTNTIWALILPGAVPLGNVILLMNAFRGVPKSLEEAAMIDGGSQWVILLKVFLPVVKPTLAAVTLFTIVGHWNDYFSALVYITDTANYPLQTYIQQLNVDITEVTDPDKLEQLARISSRTLNSAKIVVSTIPLLMIYPFMQKYFVSGIVVGSVKE